MTYGVTLFAIGLFLFSIGGLIAMARNPKAFDDDIRASVDPFDKAHPKGARTALDKVMLHDSKAKWFTRVGFGLGLVGVLIFFWSSPSDHDAIGRIGVTKQIKTN